MNNSVRENIISVIVVTYNQEDTIGRAIDSVLCQKCHVPFEIVIGEDCSTDKTRLVCEEYASRYPDIIRLMDKAPNKGVVDNYYDCLAACRGKYIADCAGDDFWVDPLKLEKEYAVLENNPEVTLVHTDWLYYDELTGQTHPPVPSRFTAPVTDGNMMTEAIVTQTDRPVIHLCTAMYRVEILLGEYAKTPTLFRNKNYGCEDLQICFIMAYKGKIAYLPDITLYYSRGTESVSSSKDHDKQFLFVKRTTELSRCLCIKYNIADPAVKHFFIQKMFALAMHSFRSHNPSLRDEVARLHDEWNMRQSTKVKAVMAVMSNKATWNMALSLRNLVVKLKGLK